MAEWTRGERVKFKYWDGSWKEGAFDYIDWTDHRNHPVPTLLGIMCDDGVLYKDVRVEDVVRLDGESG